uniref:TNF alpha induced protein 2 n=1 Tax=Rousettus aegyptiacus TaxID=9407 RepID=A0A7J8IUG0_ROUAE|nr:TNF alpha induced protein 2 [Rousettus aegyptiacus]
MLKMLTLFQGLPGQQLVPGVLDHLESPRKEPSTSEAESEASMSEASSEDLVSPLEAEAAPERGEEEASKKKKKAKGLANAALIQSFCTENGSSAAWLHQALPTLAEIIRLQDPSAIKIEVATYATCYPDFSKGHLSAILSIKGNLSNSDVKSIRSILDVNMGVREPVKSLFSLIKIG